MGRHGVFSAHSIAFGMRNLLCCDTHEHCLALRVHSVMQVSTTATRLTSYARQSKQPPVRCHISSACICSKWPCRLMVQTPTDACDMLAAH